MRDLGEVTVVSFQALAVVAGLAAGAWFLWWRRPRGTGRRAAIRRFGRLVVATVMTVALAAAAVNAYFSYLPKVSDLVDVVAGRSVPSASSVLAHPHPRRHGVLMRMATPDQVRGLRHWSALVWLPPQYFVEPSRRFDVVYLFHGSPGVPKDWFRGGEAAQVGTSLAAEGHPVIIVAPRMSKGWLDDSECVDGVHEKVESHFVHDVIPSVDAQLRTVPNRGGRVFAGMSAGGFCALNLGLRHRDLAATILDLSGLTEPTHAGGTRALFGSGQARSVELNTPARYAATLPEDPATRIWMDCGTEDGQVLRQMRSLAPVLRQRGITVVLRTRPGAHTFSVWRPALKQSLAWALGIGVGPALIGVGRGG